VVVAVAGLRSVVVVAASVVVVDRSGTVIVDPAPDPLEQPTASRRTSPARVPATSGRAAMRREDKRLILEI
jgi:hypothetical protein